VLITRPARQAAGLAQQIDALGGRPVVFPAIAILPPADPLPLERAQRDLAGFDYAVFVSANAVEYGVADPSSWPSHLVAFAPGPGTAAALAAVGIAPARIPATTMDSEGLLALPELIDAAGKRILIFRGSGGREALRDALVSRGASVVEVDCYRRGRPDADAAGLIEAWREHRIDAVTMTSSEGLDNLWAIVGAEGQRLFAATPTFVPHPRIGERARALGLAQLIVTPPADSGLIAALIEYFAARRPGPAPQD
jgi:uroporphyrinogen-III synthase